MGFFSDLFGAPKPAPVVIIYNMHEEIDRVEGVRDLWGKVDLRGRQWAHARSRWLMAGRRKPRGCQSIRGAVRRHQLCTMQP
jgi:hypothetical protein